MTHTAANKVMDTGISPVTSWVDPVSKGIVNFVAPGGQDMSSGFVQAIPTDHAKRMAAIARQDPTSKPTGHYNALKQMSPAAKPGLNSAANLQARGMKQENNLMTRARPGRFAALKATPSPAPQAMPKPQPTPMPQSMVVATGNVAARKPEQQTSKRPELRVVTSSAAPQRSAFRKRYEQLSGMSGFCFG